MKFAEVAQLLKDTKNDAYLLEGRRKGKQVLVCPSLAGRVMGTTYNGAGGDFGGFVDAKAFREGMKDIWDNWGGEERYWLCPEGGQFDLMFGGKKNCFDNYRVQDGFNHSKYQVVDQAQTGDSITMKASFNLVNGIGTRFEVESVRRITALDSCPYAVGTGGTVDFVGFQSESTITNIGKNPWTRETGCLAHWHLGQFLPGPQVIVVIPFRQGHLSDPPIREDYFREFCIDGRMPPNRYWTKDGYTLFKADGKCRMKIGQNRSRALGWLASYNLQTHEIILMDYDYYTHLDYAASYWYEQAEPFNGDCISFSAEGPGAPGEPDGRCYELESMSPAMLLAPGESFTFRTRTMHIKGPRRTMAALCRRQLGPELAALEAFDRQC
jgi:hypothetical protein